MALLWLAAQVPAWSADYRAGDLIVSQPWARPTPPSATVGAVYFSVTNGGAKADRLLSISSPMARSVEIHESRSVQGMVQMRAIPSLDCPAGAAVKIEPGALHVMLLGLKGPLTPGMEFPLSLRFRDAGVVTVRVSVNAPE
jgi:periplasmic copper chaperone A